MGKKVSAIILSGIFVSFPLLQADQKPELPEKYSKWIKEEVVYIITPKEREVFTKLETDKERDMFVELFWRQRDPTPGTPRNEFKEEHYRRIEYANKKFKRYTSLKGWQTDRGRIYITLGEPISMETFRHTSEIHPIEMWYYYGNPKFGQAPIFRLLFVRKFGVGPFELYNPIADGPKVLTPLSSMRLPASGEFTKRKGIPPDWHEKVKDPQDLAAYEIIRDNVSFELAEACWSVFPGRLGPDFMLPSSILIGEVQTYPQKKVKDDYAYEFLEHKAIVEVDYSVNYINNFSNIHVLEDRPGLFFVNYSIEPETLSVDFYQKKYFTNLKVTIRVTDMGGKTILQHTRNFPVEMDKDQMKKISQRPFHLYDSFPLIPGYYRLNILLENMVTKEFTSLEAVISVPEPGPLQMSSLLLAEKVDKDSPHARLNKAFQIGRLQVYPSLRNQFFNKKNLFLFFQIYGLLEELKEKGSLEFAFFKGEQEFHTITQEISAYENTRDFLQEISLERFQTGEYKVKVTLLDGDGMEILSDTKKFYVSSTPLPESWIVSQSNPPGDDPVYSHILGNQFLNKGEFRKACTELEKALNARPDSLDSALSYAKALLVMKEFQNAKDVLLPFSRAKKENFGLYYYLGISCQSLGELEEAISYYQNALSHKGNVIEVLNRVGQCFLDLGDKKQALRAWQRSLEVNPNQEKIRKIIELLKEKK